MQRAAVAVVLLVFVLSVPARASDLPAEGDTLPSLTLPAVVYEDWAGELGVSPDATFRLADLPAKVALIEILGVYCPQCHIQAPAFNKLKKRLDRAGLSDKAVMIGVAAGGYPPEIAHLRKQGTYAFPVIADTDFNVHRALNEPETPFTMIVDTKTGRVHYAHLGVVEDVSPLFARIKALAR